MLSGQVSRGKASSPCTSAWKVPKARNDSAQGMTMGLSSRRAATLGWPITASPACAPLSKRPSIAASATG